MKMKTMTVLLALAALMVAGNARAASEDPDREGSAIGKMFHKLGRGITNILTCWVEIPRTISKEWVETDPATGIVLGTVKGVGWSFTRLATGAYETATFPFPIPPNYEPMMSPEFVVTDTWGDGIPDLTLDESSDSASKSGTHPQNFNF